MTPESANQPVKSRSPLTARAPPLIGVIHQATGKSELGLLTIVAGGPQYRGGCGRQLVELARRISSEGVPVMRFDHRGLGDSAGGGVQGSDISKWISAARSKSSGTERRR